MSIIYEALKKVEETQGKDLALQIDKSHKHKYKIYLLYATVLCSGFLIANIIFNLFISLSYENSTNLSKSKKDSIYLTESTVKKEFPAAEKQDINIYPELPIKKQKSPSLVLNGIFFSENQVYALINNRIIREGDVIEGATVKRITLEGVELEIEGSLFSLSSSAAQ